MKKFLAAMLATLMFAASSVAGAGAFEFKPYDGDAVQQDIAAGKPVVVHVYASWCLQCRAQETILGRLSSDTTYDGISFYRVDYDKQKDVVKAFAVPRSTLIAFKGGAEVSKMSWGTSTESVVGVLNAVN